MMVRSTSTTAVLSILLLTTLPCRVARWVRLLSLISISLGLPLRRSGALLAQHSQHARELAAHFPHTGGRLELAGRLLQPQGEELRQQLLLAPAQLVHRLVAQVFGLVGRLHVRLYLRLRAASGRAPGSA